MNASAKETERQEQKEEREIKQHRLSSPPKKKVRLNLHKSKHAKINTLS